MRSKRCSKCGETKTLAEFYRDRRKLDRLRSNCKECNRAYNEEHKEEQRAYQRAYRESHRAELRAYDEARREEKRAYREAHKEEISARERAYREAHREECNAQYRKLKTEARKASREVATRNGEPWTPAEDKVALTSDGTILEIAIELGRTTSSVNARRKILRRKAVTA